MLINSFKKSIEEIEMTEERMGKDWKQNHDNIIQNEKSLIERVRLIFHMMVVH